MQCQRVLMISQHEHMSTSDERIQARFRAIQKQRASDLPISSSTMRFRRSYTCITVPFYLLYGFAILSSAVAHDFPDRILTAETDAFIDQVLVDWNSPGGV